MVEVEIDVKDDRRRVGEIVYWVVTSGKMRGRIDYSGTHRVSRFTFSDFVDAVYFKLAWVGNGD